VLLLNVMIALVRRWREHSELSPRTSAVFA